MKKYLKSLAKKSMSLFLAVLMLLSCWVWVAPTEADAAKYTPLTQYTVTIKWQLVDRKGKYTGGNIKYKTLGDGWGSESSKQTAISSLGDCLTNNKSYSKTFTTTSFPSVVEISYEGGNTGWGGLTQDKNKARCEVLEILINDKTVWKGNVGYNGQNSQEFYATNTEGTAGGSGGTYSWPRPKLVGFNDDTAAASDIAVSLNQIGGQDIKKTADYNIAKYDCYNQYGVKISDPTNYINNGRVCTVTEQSTYVANTKNSDDPITGEDVSDIYAESNTSDSVILKPNLQVSNPKASTGAATYYLVRKYVLDDMFGGSVTSKVSAKIDVTYPKYTVTFNGGLSTAKIVADKEYTGSYAPTGYHGANITVPSKTTADGYTFYEYWSKPQPATGAASYNAAASEFAQPCSSEEYASYKADGGEEENGILTDKDGGKWYDAGKKLDPSSAKTIDVSDNKANFADTWYAWWLAKDLSVKFYDVDGTFLGEKLVKSGQTQSAITWPTSKYLTSGYTTGAFKFKVDANIWETTDGTEINKNSYTFSKDLILTPKLTRESFQSKYAVTFINPNNGNSVGVGTDGTYDYRANIKSYADTAKGKIAAVPSDVDGDLQYRYELLGWSSVVPTTGKKYHVLLEDADFDVNGTAIGLNSDWVVRDNATYYPVYRRFTQTYVVKFTYKDATGADATRQVKFKYGEKLVAPTEYVPYNYVTKGFGYEFANWEYTNAKGIKATFAYAGEVAFTSENFEIAAAALDDGVDVEPIAVKALYGAPVATPYSVTFNYIKDEEECSSGVTVKNEEFILQGTVDNLKSDEEWDDGEYLYTFANQWEITEGAATVGVNGTEKKVGDKINTADLITLTPTSNITFKAVYVDPVPFYTVTYIDGANTWSKRVLKDSNVPAWTYEVNNDNGTPDDPSDDKVEDKVYLPADYEGEGGTYVFQGWYDQKQTDTEYKATNGNKVTTADKVESNLTLYSQFKFVADKFLIKFMNHDGTVQLAAREFEKGQNIEALTAEATKAAQGRASDETYTYMFLGWDKAVPTFCEGYAVTYTAIYKPVYKYYDVKWYNSTLDEDGNWVADKTIETVEGKETEKYLLKTTHHTYNSKLYTPSVNTVCPVEAPNGQTYAFAGWYYTDAEGNAVKYERGMKVTAEMEFYATYTLTDKTYTVTTVVKGTETKYTVADGETAPISVPQAGYVDAEKHDAFAGWYTDAAYATEFDAESVITTDTKIYAKFEESAHKREFGEDIKAPDYYTVGKRDTWCECNKEKTTITVDIPVLQDEAAPTGTIYLGGQSWSSTDTVGATATDDDPISIFVNAKSDVIITAKDEGIGVEYIRAFAFPADKVLTATNYGAAQSVATVIYEDTTTAITTNANFATKISDIVVAELDEDGNPVKEGDKVKFGPLEDGEDYIIYYYVTDKATTANGAPENGNLLNRFVRTAKFTYDNTAPAFDVTSDNVAANNTFCGSATVTGFAEDVVLNVNNEAVELNEDGNYVIEYAEGMDNVLITATDKAGNTFSKKIKLTNHIYVVDEQEATCGQAGYRTEACILCDYVKSSVEYEALAHIWSDRQVIPADCVNNGIVVVTCSICGEEVTTEFEEDGVTPAIPAEGHEYATDANGDIIYTTVTESTCTTKGLGEAYCTVCGEGKLEKELELNPEKHEKIETDELAADCENDGYYRETCICGEKIKEEIYSATGHGTLADGTAEWYERTAPTCYQPGEQVLKCKNCSNFIEVDGAEVTKEIDATGEHVKTVTNPESYKTDGFVYYHCATVGCNHAFEPKKYVADVTKEYTVTFKNENGDEITKFTVVEGSSIQKGAVDAPAKDNSEDGKFKYTFAGWADADGKVYKLPLTPSSDLVLTASYKETTIKYTHIFKAPKTYDGAAKDFATLVGAIGDVRVPANTPVLKEDANYTYTFAGWVDKFGKAVDTFTVAGDAEFTAVFTREAKTYNVTFYNGVGNYISSVTVTAGEPVTYNGETPEKAFDDTYHYVFNNTWYTDEACENAYEGGAITENTRLYAGYTAIKHKDAEAELDNYVVNTAAGENGVIQKVDCLHSELTEYICTCGHTEIRETKSALGHDMSTPEYNGETGKMVSNCQNDGCDYTESTDASFTVRFENWNGTKATRIYEAKVEIGKSITYDFEKYGTPERATDDQYGYVFAGWLQVTYDDEGKEVLSDPYATDYTFENIFADATYRAYYTTTDRYYTVSYLDVDNNVLQTADVKYGDPIPAYTGKTPVKKYDNFKHYVFANWSVEGDTIVTRKITIDPVFTAIEHTYTETELPATCTQAGGIYKECTCGYSYNSTETVPKKEHTYVEYDREVADDAAGIDGKIYYRCSVCGDEKTEKIKAQSFRAELKVVDTNGNPVAGAVVTFYNSELGIEDRVTTGEDGIAKLTAKKGEYKYSVSYAGKEVISYEKLKEGASTTAGINTGDECSCSCHRQNFWGIIFRLLQKFIKLFTNKIGCCSCPDAAYGA